MAREPQPKGPVKAVGGEYDWLQGRPDRAAILAHARKTGAAIPEGLHVDAHGKSMIVDGIRQGWRLKDADLQTDYAVRARLRGLGYTVEPDEHGEGYNTTISQEKFEENERIAQARYTAQRDAARRLTGEKNKKNTYEEKELETDLSLTVDDIFDEGEMESVA